MKKITFLTIALAFFGFNANAQTPCTPNDLPLSLQNGLAGYYPFCGNANDQSGNNLNGTVVGATLTTDRFGAANSAYLFDGSSNYIALGSNFDLLPRSISFWFNTSLIDVTNRFVYCSDNNMLVNGLTNFGVMINNNSDSWWSTVSTVNQFSPVTQNAWHHAVVVVDSNFTYKYIDGQLIFTDPVTSFLASSFGVNYAVIGASRYTTNGFFKGIIDDVIIYDRALASNEVALLYNNQNAIASVEYQDHINVYPNPATTEVTINFGKAKRYHVQLCNTLGEVLEQTQISSSMYSPGISSYPPGLYFIQVKTEQETIHKKIIIQK